MITGLILTAILTFVNFIFGLLSGAAIATGVSDGIVAFFNYTYQFNNLLPIDTALQLLHYAADFWILVLGFEISKWIIHLLRGN